MAHPRPQPTLLLLRREGTWETSTEASRETRLSGTLAESSRSGGHAIPSVLLGCRQIYADSLEVVQMGANHLAAYDISAILGR
jgi:hypothetical protein